jgi:hypothetical protein
VQHPQGIRLVSAIKEHSEGSALVEVPVVYPAARDLAFALPAPQRGRGPAGPSVGQLAFAGDGVTGAGATEAVRLVVAEIAGGSGDAHDDRVFGQPGLVAVVVGGVGVGAVPTGGVVVQADSGRAGRSAVPTRWAPGECG